MKLQDQVCTLAQAKTLQGLGVKKESCFYWTYVDDFDVPHLEDHDLIEGCVKKFRAYTVSELGQMLPQKFNVAGFGETQLLIAKYDKWYVLYVATETAPYAKERSDSLAESMAAMLIFLLERKIITAARLDEIEQRLDANGIYK